MFENNPIIKPNFKQTLTKSDKPEFPEIGVEKSRDYLRQCAKLEDKVALFKKNNPYDKFEVAS